MCILVRLDVVRIPSKMMRRANKSISKETVNPAIIAMPLCDRSVVIIVSLIDR